VLAAGETRLASKIPGTYVTGGDTGSQVRAVMVQPLLISGNWQQSAASSPTLKNVVDYKNMRVLLLVAKLRLK
jgi:hypothetical protein